MLRLGKVMPRRKGQLVLKVRFRRHLTCFRLRISQPWWTWHRRELFKRRELHKLLNQNSSSSRLRTARIALNLLCKPLIRLLIASRTICKSSNAPFHRAKLPPPIAKWRPPRPRDNHSYNTPPCTIKSATPSKSHPTWRSIHRWLLPRHMLI